MHRGLGVIDRLHDPIYQCDGSDLLSRHCTGHVVIEGGVAGNAALVAVFATMGIVAWWTLRRHARAESSPTTNK